MNRYASTQAAVKASVLRKTTTISLSVTSISSVILKNIFTSVLMSCPTQFWNASTGYKNPGSSSALTSERGTTGTAESKDINSSGHNQNTDDYRCRLPAKHIPCPLQVIGSRFLGILGIPHLGLIIVPCSPRISALRICIVGIALFRVIRGLALV